MARTVRRQLEEQHLLFGDIFGAEQPKTCTIKDELNIGGVKHVLAMSLK